MPDPSLSEIILSEVRELRTSQNEHARATGERLATLEAAVKEIAGNGKPGRLGQLEERVESLSAWRYKIVGLSIGAGAVVSFLFRFDIGH